MARKLKDKDLQKYGSRISGVQMAIDKPSSASPHAYSTKRLDKGLDEAVSKIGAKTKQGMSDAGSFGSAFKAARAAAIKAGRDPNKETFTWRGEKKVARMAGSTPKPTVKRDAPAAKAPAERRTPPTPKGAPPVVRGNPPQDAGPFGSVGAPSFLKRTPGMKDVSSYVEERAAPTPIKAVRRGALEGLRQRRNVAAEAAAKKDKEAKDMAGVPAWRNNPDAFTTKKLAKGGSIDGCAIRGKTKAR